jgi:hypothetical protein
MLYLNLGALRAKRISTTEAEQVAKDAIERIPGVHQALTASELRQLRIQGARWSAVSSFYPDRSGNVYYEPRPYVLLTDEPTGADHGSPWAYDAQVPLLWFGASIKPGVHHGPASIADIAPTVSVLLGISPPAGTQGRVLNEMMR